MLKKNNAALVKGSALSVRKIGKIEKIFLSRVSDIVSIAAAVALKRQSIGDSSRKNWKKEN